MTASPGAVLPHGTRGPAPAESADLGGVGLLGRPSAAGMGTDGGSVFLFEQLGFERRYLLYLVIC